MAIKKKVMLLMFDPKYNNNKYYEMELHDDDVTYVKFGRVGAGAQNTQYGGGERKFDSLMRAKLKKGYHEVAIEESAGEVDVGKSKAQNVIDVAMDQIVCADDEARALVKRIAAANIHNIVSNSSVQYDAATGLFKTALGVIKEFAVMEAITILDMAEKLLPVADEQEDNLFDLSVEYFTRIPNKVANARDKVFLLFSKDVIDRQRSVCSSLLDTLELVADLKEKAKIEAEQKAKTSKPVQPKIFDVTISTLKDKSTYDHLVNYYETSKKAMHSYNVKQSKITNIYKIDIGNQLEPFNKKSAEIGNVQELFHGTRVANLLSILAKGLMMPKDSPASKAGAMFGLGVYFANSSSKSAGYCDGGVWSGGNRGKMYMFVADVAIGKYEVPKSSTGSSGKPKQGYDSFWAKAGISGVMNDELIVFDLAQIKLNYLLEIEV